MDVGKGFRGGEKGAEEHPKTFPDGVGTSSTLWRSGRRGPCQRGHGRLGTSIPEDQGHDRAGHGKGTAQLVQSGRRLGPLNFGTKSGENIRRARKVERALAEEKSESENSDTSSLSDSSSTLTQ